MHGSAVSSEPKPPFRRTELFQMPIRMPHNRSKTPPGKQMMRFRPAAIAAAVSSLLCASTISLGIVPPAWGQNTAPTGPSGAAAQLPAPAPPRPQRLSGYLGKEHVPDHEVFLPPPPASDSALGKADLEVYRSTRALENTPRWKLAASDAALSQQALFDDFECAAGVDLDVAAMPALSHLLRRSMADLSGIIGPAKERYARPRPFLVEEAPLCVVATEGLARSGSYPSGHSATGWLYALVLAELAPDRAAEILARGRAIGESRVVCGVHFVSDVDAGRTTAAAVIAALNGVPEFDADLAAARAEIDAARSPDVDAAAPARATPDPAQCAADAELLRRPW
jgi:acid phosphatase (class A)